MKVKGLQDTVDWYNQNAKQYSDVSQNLAAPDQINEFVKLVPKGSKVLDAGCASGRDSKLISDKDIKVIGLDLSSEFIKLAKSNYPNIEFVEGNLINIPFKNNTFGGVWAHASVLHLESVEDVNKSFSEFYRVLIPNGILHVYVKEQTGKNKFAVITDKLSNHDRFFQFFTKTELQKNIEENGFKVIKLENTKDLAAREGVKWILCLARKL